ncbi:lytic transglycosylase domain-containing protein [Flaviaesturariibacter flavus]|uniref:Lytic transglycosylase domain-containing protein n=1 Tax=Flaviaesturariibacter flavus TaxID=2502780 RepID=A0A4R1B7U0_9BACT|nr:lytic transglycosylase domain-containing protein [Flaviaesturariibacter flavus]TCJ12425.1 lytic transglycosylase domain-containing protein [Flaviaesturariibacter flavus]
MKHSHRTILNIALGLILGILVAGQFAFDRPLIRLHKEDDRNNAARILAPPLPEQLSFAGETVPLQRWDVKERLEREVLVNYYSNANMIFLVKTANRYFPVIEERLKANGVPDDFKYLCIAESNLVPAAISGAGAASFWQFMDGTAPGYGLEVNKEVDQRYDLARATDAAAVYLKSAYAKFGSWTAAAASYNCGQGGYNGQATFQGTNNYYDLQLPEETNRYIFRILTFKYLLENSEKLGFVVPEGERYGAVPTRSVTVNASIPNLATWARAQGTTYKMVRQLNPWLRGRSLTVSSGKSYTVQLPAEGKSF